VQNFTTQVVQILKYTTQLIVIPHPP